MIKKFYLFMIELFWFIEHRKAENIACLGFRYRKSWEHKYVNRFKENIYGQPVQT